MSGLGADARQLLEAYKVSTKLQGSRDAANWHAIEARVRADEVPPVIERERRTSLLVAAGVAVAILATAAAAILWLGGTSIPLLGDGPSGDPNAAGYEAVDIPAEGDAAEREAKKTRARSSRSTIEVEPPAPPAAQDDEIEVIEPEPEPVPAKVPAPARSPSRDDRNAPRRVAPPVDPEPPVEPSTDALREEALLLARARAALRDGAAERALRLLRTHARTFPHGALTPERQVLEISALCASGEQDGAQALAARYAKAHPGSTIAAKQGRICAD